MKTIVKLYSIPLLLLIALAANAKVSQVQCTGQPSDRALIQATLDQAKQGDKIQLLGTCQLDGQTLHVNQSNLKIYGGPNWSTVLKGLANPNGLPIGGVSSGSASMASGLYINNGLTIGDDSGNAQIKNVVIQDIKFSTLNLSIRIAPEIGGNSPICEVMTNGSGSATAIVVDHNWFDNVNAAARSWGRADNLQYSNNLVTNHVGQSAFLFEGHCILCLCTVNTANCTFPDFNLADYPVLLGDNNNGSIVGNTIITSGQQGINIQGTNKSVVKDNIVGSGPATEVLMFVGSTTNAKVTDNKLDGTGGLGGFGAIGIFNQDEVTTIPNYPTQSSNVVITKNTISNTLVGVGVESFTTGRNIIQNQISGTDPLGLGGADIYLCGTQLGDPLCVFYLEVGPSESYNNQVVAFPVNSIINNGVNNTITIKKKNK